METLELNNDQINNEPYSLPPHQAKKPYADLPSNAANNYPGFEYTPGLKQPEKPEFKLSDLGSAVYEVSSWGSAQRITEDTLRPDYAVPGYDFIEYVDDQFLNDNDIWYFVNDVNSSQTIANNNKLKRQRNAEQGMQNYPWRYSGAYIAGGLIDPVNWAFPGTRIATATKEAYLAAKAGKTAATAKSLAIIGAESAALGGASGAVQEALIQQTHIEREIRDSVFNVFATAALSGVMGAVVPAAISGFHYAKANSQVANILAGNTPTPTQAPTSKVFAMDMATKAQMQGDDVVAALPEVTKKALNISPAGRLRNSESISANIASTDLATTVFTLNKNIAKNIPTQTAVDEHIAQLRGKARKTSLDINAIFMEQQGIRGNMFGGVRSRIAEARSKGLNRIQFSEAMYEAMESGNPSAYPAVNTAVTRVKKYLTEIKQELVEFGNLDKKFLEPEFDNYFTHHWLEPVISRKHEDFKLLTFKWYNEVNNFYKANRDILQPLVARVEFAEKELSKAARNLERVKRSEDYLQFQSNKKTAMEGFKSLRQQTQAQLKEVKKEVKALQKSGDKQLLEQKLATQKELEQALGLIKTERKTAKATRHARQVELEERIEKYKNLLEKRKEILYSKIPPKYLTPGGWIPLGDKNPLELHAAAMQTFYRTTGSDVASFINPLIGGANAKPDPLQARLLTIPYNYTAQGFDGNTIIASDFLSKDIWRMIDNYAGATASTMGFSRLARARGFKDPSELKAWYLKNIEADYDEMLRGKSGKEALDLVRAKKKDFNNLNALWDQQENIAGKSLDIFGQGFARFSRRLRQYNSERLLGSAAMSSLTDPFVAPFRQGIFNYIQDWLVPFVGQIAGPNKAIKMNKRDIQDAGFAIETQMGFIAKKFYDNDDLLIEQKWWHNIAEPAVNMFGNITGLSQISDYVGAQAGHVSISRTLRTITKKIEKGKISERDRIRLRHVGISEESEKHIYDMFKEKGGTDKGAYYSNHNEWNLSNDARSHAYEEFVNSWQRDIAHSTLRSSKSEQPAFYESTLGKMLFHFKDYLLASTQKLFLSGIQKIGMREYEVMFASMMLLSSGVMSYIFNSLAKDPTGSKLDLSPEKLLREGLDRSALLGLFMEPINMFQKQGWLPGQTVSRYQSRGILGNWVGPEIGTAQDLTDALISPLVRKLKDEGNYTTKDALQILRLIPFQNLFYLRYLNEQLAKGVAESLGATPKE